MEVMLCSFAVFYHYDFLPAVVARICPVADFDATITGFALPFILLFVSHCLSLD